MLAMVIRGVEGAIFTPGFRNVAADEVAEEIVEEATTLLRLEEKGAGRRGRNAIGILRDPSDKAGRASDGVPRVNDAVAAAA